MAEPKELQSSMAYKLTLTGLLVTAAGIAILYVSGGEMPVVPPGFVMLLVAAGLVAWGPWRWTPIAGIVAALAEAGGFFGSGSAANLGDLDPFGIFAGTWVRLIGIVLALVYSIVATKLAFTKKAASPAQA
jgi:hypothetical protein